MTPAELAAANVAMVYGIAYRRAAAGPIDDLVGDGMVGLCQAAHRFDASRFDGPFSTYAKTRVEGAMIDGIRRRHYYGTHDNHSAHRRPDYLPLDMLPEAMVPTVPSPEDAVSARLALGSLLEQVAALPEALQVPIRVVMGGDTFKDAAAREGITESGMSRRLTEARRRLRGVA